MTFDELCEEYEKIDKFMEPEIIEDSWYEIDGPMGIEYVPMWLVGTGAKWEELSDYCENREVWTIEEVRGFGARLSAPGYMDCTEWAVFDTEQEAIDYLEQMYIND